MNKMHSLFFIILLCSNLEFSTVEALKCGREQNVMSDRIFGGGIAEKAEFPWNVAFVHKQAEKFFCGGSLISAKHVLSAAHCFQNKNFREPLSPDLAQALLGKFNLSIVNETGSETLSVSEIVIHPDWKYDHEKYDADLSVVVLERAVTFSDFIRPICLPKQSDDYVTGTGTVVGWGKSETSGGTSASVPSKLEVPAIDPVVCYTTFHQLARYSSPRMFCSGFADLRKAPCLGDSGGGFYLQNEEDSWEIRGIVSGSIIADEHGCDINKFALFTHVAKFTDWIEKNAVEAMSVDWKFVEFMCVEHTNSKDYTTCYTTLREPMTRNSKILADFSAHESKTSPVDVTILLLINFEPSTHVLSGIGEEFLNLQTLAVTGNSIKFIERQNFANLTQLAYLGISQTSVEFLPEDLLADLPNLTSLEIRYCDKLERFPEKFFMNQHKLESISLAENGLTILQKDLFKNNLKLEELSLYGNRLIEIYVDFTRLPAVREIDARYNQCNGQYWEQKMGSIQYFQNNIKRNCQPPRGV